MTFSKFIVNRLFDRNLSTEHTHLKSVGDLFLLCGGTNGDIKLSKDILLVYKRNLFTVSYHYKIIESVMNGDNIMYIHELLTEEYTCLPFWFNYFVLPGKVDEIFLKPFCIKQNAIPINMHNIDSSIVLYINDFTSNVEYKHEEVMNNDDKIAILKYSRTVNMFECDVSKYINEIYEHVISMNITGDDIINLKTKMVMLQKSLEESDIKISKINAEMHDAYEYIHNHNRLYSTKDDYDKYDNVFRKFWVSSEMSIAESAKHYKLQQELLSNSTINASLKKRINKIGYFSFI